MWGTQTRMMTLSDRDIYRYQCAGMSERCSLWRQGQRTSFYSTKGALWPLLLFHYKENLFSNIKKTIAEPTKVDKNASNINGKYIQTISSAGKTNFPKTIKNA
jgi:hypothetical protein